MRLKRLSSSGETSPETAAVVYEILSRHPADSEIMDAAQSPATSVIHEFINGKEGEAPAGDWVASLPEGAAKSRAATTLIDRWAESDPEAASAWIKDLPAGETRENATVQLISEISGEDPESALIWAQSMRDEEKRRTQTAAVLRSWLSKNPHQAIAALQQFPEEEQTAMFARE